MKPHRLTFSIPNARELILSGKKTQTLRLTNHRGTIEAGDPLVLEEWIGKPRAKGSKRRIIMRATCSETKEYVVRLEMEVGRVFARTGAAGELLMLSQDEHIRLARRDGFDSWAELVEVLREFYGERPVEMVAIRW